MKLYLGSTNTVYYLYEFAIISTQIPRIEKWLSRASRQGRTVEEILLKLHDKRGSERGDERQQFLSEQ
jgi:hypothetical protein